MKFTKSIDFKKYMHHLYNVMTKQNKGKLVNFRVREDLKREFEITAELRGTTLSGLIHQLLVKAVREEKDREPQAFGIVKLESLKITKAENGGKVNEGGTKRKAG